MEFAEAFQQGGVLMFPIAGGGAVAWALGVLAPLVRSRSLALVALGGAAITLAIGAFAWAKGMSEVDEALRYVAPEQAAMAREFGTRIARIPLLFAALGAAPGLVGGLLGLAVGRRPPAID